MNKFCVFAGTTEGRKIVEFLCERSACVTACVATEYGQMMLTPARDLTIVEKRLDEAAMEEFFKKEAFDLVLDATHPYASLVTENIKTACKAADIEYLRLCRADSDNASAAVYVPDIATAANYLDKTQGNILLTTGSKELKSLMSIRDFAGRAYARVLPMRDSIRLCEEAGLKTSHIIAMQGPFSEEMNIALIRSVRAKYLLTKESGTAGGFAEKISAAEKTGISAVVIGRPEKESGLSFCEVLKVLEERYGYVRTPEVTVVGIGPGSQRSMTDEVREAIRRADCLIGAGRMLEAVRETGQECISLIDPVKIAEYIREHREFTSFAVVMSGDSGFFSGTKKLLPLLDFCKVKVLAGLSSLSVMAAALGRSYEDVRTVSVHGRDLDVIPEVRANRDVFILTGGDPDIRRICRDLTDASPGEVRMHIGERLSYPEQKITSGSPEEILKGEYEKLSVIWIENPDAGERFAFGLPESAFIRGEGRRGPIPMTKPEVRAVILSKLRLSRDSISWDIGAGTGSVSVEMALFSSAGRVFAVDHDPDAIGVLKKNIEHFHLKNVVTIEGRAPEACIGLPAPDRVFIGGSSGSVSEIIRIAREKNPKVLIAAASVTLESAAQLTGALKEFEWQECDITSVSISSARTAGSYHLMTAQNPITIYTMHNDPGLKIK